MLASAAGNKRDLDKLLAAAQSRHGWPAEYLTTQILADLSPKKRTFLLQTRLRQALSGPAIADLHRCAATWLAQQDQVSAAVQDALAADDLSLAAAILETLDMNDNDLAIRYSARRYLSAPQ